MRQFTPTYRYLPGLGYVGTGATPTFSTPPMYAGGGSTPPAALAVAKTMRSYAAPGAVTQSSSMPGSTGGDFASFPPGCGSGGPCDWDTYHAQQQAALLHAQGSVGMPTIGGGGAVTTTPKNGDAAPSIADAQQIAPDVMGTGTQSPPVLAPVSKLGWSGERKVAVGVAVAAALAAVVAWRRGFRKLAYGAGAATALSAWVAWKQPTFGLGR